MIDHAIGGLYFDPIEDPRREASATLDNLEPLVLLIAEGLGECASLGGAVEKIREAAERLAEASTLLRRQGADTSIARTGFPGDGRAAEIKAALAFYPYV